MTQQFCILDSYSDLIQAVHAGYTTAKFELLGWHLNTTRCVRNLPDEGFNIQHRSVHARVGFNGDRLCIETPVHAHFEDCANHILLNVLTKRRKFLLNVIVMLKDVADTWVLHTPTLLTQTPSETLQLMQTHADTLVPRSEHVNMQMQTMERQVCGVSYGNVFIMCVLCM